MSDSAGGGHDWPLWEVFIRSKGGMAHRHVGSVHAPDPKLALAHARDTYTRRQEGVSLWVVKSDEIVASDPPNLTFPYHVHRFIALNGPPCRSQCAMLAAR